MEPSGSVTQWIRSLQQGDSEAASHLWDRYFRRLAALVRSQYGSIRSGQGNESDVALGAFQSFCRGLQEGKFASLQGRDELWKVLVVIAKRKAVDCLRRENARKRGGGQVQGDAFLSDLIGVEPTPDVTAELLDEFRHVLDLLAAEDGTLCLIALRKFEGYTNQEIAAELSTHTRTVQRKCERIRIIWAADVERRDSDGPP
jgi:DNA-directed RNA polymerase specialized sigma24 family protein